MDLIGDALLDGLSTESTEINDYIGNEGLLYCGKCNTPRETALSADKSDILARSFKVKSGKLHLPIMCRCKTAEFEKEKSEQDLKDFNRRVGRLREYGLTDKEYENWTFDKDDRKNPSISNSCRNYVDNWEGMISDNVGLLFYGSVGTGKTFYACCIANSLIDKGVTALVTNFPHLLKIIQSSAFNENVNVISRLQKYDLVVIDDLGVERNTDYAIEQVYSLIDTRYRSGKPLIITTNLAPHDIAKPANIAYERIYDRIKQNSIPVKMVGESRRKEIGRTKQAKYKDLLGF